ncbi:MAG: hypothetical protein J6O56_02560 [Bacilli bacterium]|nr:hypothetical protein [Bacilli bacterium]
MPLIPDKISDERINELIRIISNLARNPKRLEINDNSSKEDILFAKYAKLILKNCNVNHYDLPDIPNSKIIISNKVYNKLCDLSSKSNSYERNLVEFGAFLYGREISPNTIYFEEYNYHRMISSKGEINVSDELIGEIERVIRESSADCIAHIHTHPYSNNLFSCYPSNQDLYTYAHLQENFNTTNRNVYFLGGLITPLNSSSSNIRLNDICFIFYDKDNGYFYKCDNIYTLNEMNEEIPLSKAVVNKKKNGLVLKEKRTILQNASHIEENN